MSKLPASGARTLIKRPLGFQDQIAPLGRPLGRPPAGHMLDPSGFDSSGFNSLGLGGLALGAWCFGAVNSDAIWRALLADETLFPDEALHRYLEQLRTDGEIDLRHPLGDLLFLASGERGAGAEFVVPPSHRLMIGGLIPPLAFPAPGFAASATPRLVRRPIVVSSFVAEPVSPAIACEPEAPGPVEPVECRDAPTLRVDAVLRDDRAIVPRTNTKWQKTPLIAILALAMLSTSGAVLAPLFSHGSSAPPPLQRLRSDVTSTSPVVALISGTTRAGRDTFMPSTPAPSWQLDDAPSVSSMLTIAPVTIGLRAVAMPVAPEPAPAATPPEQEVANVAGNPPPLAERDPTTLPAPSAPLVKAAGPSAKRKAARKVAVRVAGGTTARSERIPSLTLPDALKPH